MLVVACGLYFPDSFIAKDSRDHNRRLNGRFAVIKIKCS